MQPQGPSSISTGSRELSTRLVAGLVLAIVALGLTWAGIWPFALLVLSVALLVAWEWGRIVRSSGFDTIFLVSAVTTIAAVLLVTLGMPGLGLIVVIVGAILAALLGFGNRGHLASMGVLYSGLPAISLVWLRAAGLWGLPATLFIFLVVWATDTGAYMIGRLVGGPRLAPRISPNKTWSGLAGGVACAILVGGAMASFVNEGRFARMALIALALALISQAGDMMESVLKREHGVKDASELIPGHGGFMDRVDGLIVAAVLAALFGLAVNVHDPARALLTWH